MMLHVEIFKRFLTLFIAEGFTTFLGFKRVSIGPTASVEALTPVTGPVVEESGNPRLAAATIHEL